MTGMLPDVPNFEQLEDYVPAETEIIQLLYEIRDLLQVIANK